jgi:cell pole-organizing protein PopZ
MNKPATKEPSMDEILSSIRQIIADDDASGAPRRTNIQAAPPPMQAAPVRVFSEHGDRDLNDMLEDMEPLALSQSQIVGEVGTSNALSFEDILADTEITELPETATNVAEMPLVEPEDVGFAVDEDEEEEELPAFDPPPARVFAPEPVRAQTRPQPSIAQAAPMPDPDLATDMANQLLEPATQAAVRSSMTRLNGMGLGNSGATIESLMRDMLRPMLKEWLDENLPSVVERMVEKEIARISRGD